MANTALDTELPKDRRDQEIFVLNDLTLKVAPTQISVQSENLTYQYKTLRSRTSTRIPTGHGNMLAHVTIPFLNSELLMLHRLVVEYRASPFMYVENRYLREVCTPYDWPPGKSMVFGCTNLQVQPMAGTSDAWVVDMDLVWFNYEPFGFNWLYREDWLTYPIELQEDPSIPDGIERGKWGEYGIGWQLDRITGERHSVPVIINRHDEWPEIPEQASYMDPAKAPSTRAWDLRAEEARKSGGQRTIYNMHGAHLGAEFDTLPLPGNMQPSRWVIEPQHSNVYVRYINLLQRDALYKNFGLDIEADLSDWSFNTSDALDPWFRATNDPATNRKRTYSLHSAPKDLRDTWIRKMLENNDSVNFAYAQYIEVEFPEDIREAMDKQQTQALLEQNDRASAAYGAASQNHNDPNGSELALPFTGEKRRLNSPYGPRDGKRISPGASSFHRGMDFRGAKGSPLFSPVSGRVIYAEDKERIGKTLGKFVVIRGDNGEHWHFFHMNYVPWKTGRNPVGVDGLPVRVEPGTYIGQVGMTGRGLDGKPISSGPHIHLGYSGPGVEAGFTAKQNFQDPTGRLQQLLRTQSARWWESSDSDVEELNPGTSLAQSLDVSEDQSTLTSLDPTNLQQSTLKEGFQKENGLTEEQTQSLVDFWQEMQEDGWLPYVDDINLRNVWYRPLELSIRNGGNGTSPYDEPYYNDGAVVTNVSGRLSAILSRLPILDHEYPTLQHLGSTEPSYMIEVASIDDRPDLEGLSYLGQNITRMRSHLQANARRFRPVVDAWAVATDTFITRLLGSFHEGPPEYGGSDLMVEHIDDDPTYYRMRKRTICDFQNAGTIEGSPGLSTIQLELSETNPYLPTQLIATGPRAEDVDRDYARILNALYNMDVKDKYKKSIATLLVADIFDLSEDPRKLRKLGTLSGAISSVYEDTSIYGVSPADPTLQWSDQGFALRTQGNEADMLKALVDSYAASTDDPDSTVLLPFSTLPDLAEGLSDYRELDTSLSGNAKQFTPGQSGQGLLGSAADQANALLTGSKYLRFSGLTTENPELRDLDVSKLLQLYNAVHDTVRHANLYIEESDTGGVPEEVVTGLLYDLPVSPCMWQGWQEFLLEFGRQQDNLFLESSTQAGAAGSKSLRNHPGWRSRWRRRMPASLQRYVRDIVTKNGGLFGDPIGDKSEYVKNTILLGFTALPVGRFFRGASVLAQVMRHGSTKLTRAALRKIFPRVASLANNELTRRGAVGAGFSAAFYAAALKDLFQESKSQFITHLATAYISSFPLDVRIREGAYDFARSTLMNLTTNEQSSRSNEHEQFSIDYPNLWTDLRMHIAPTGLVSGFQGNGRPFIQEPIPVSGWVSNSLSYNNTYRTDLDEEPGPYHYGPEDPAKHEGKEMIKIRQIRESLAFIAKSVKSDPQLMRIFGLDDLLALEHHKAAPGVEAYPDLILPPHPYYADTYSVSPDFYLWNMYEDGGAFREEVRQNIQSKVDAVVERAYDTFSALRTKDPEEKEAQDSVQNATQELGLDKHPALPQIHKPVFNAEASDIQADGSGPGTPFFQQNESVNLKQVMDSAKISNKNRILSSKPQDWMVVPPRLSLTEGSTSGGSTPNWGGAQYAFRVKPSDYAALNSQWESATDMFGSREGHLNSYLTSDGSAADDIVDKSQGTSTEQLQPFEHTHAYDPGTLKKLARDSSHDMVSMKRSMRRAYPTFKFYIIEEDEVADRFIAHDDFHTYNGVKEFTVVQSRKMPADHAVITLQNIAGTLDGSRRNAIVDVDYFAKADSSGFEQQSVRKLQEQGYSPGEAKVVSREGTSAEGTAGEQAFSSVVLRPGMNVQLRVGYSNHPDELHVLISGRVVDMQWNKSGDLAEIMVQSFGTELTQHVKGFAKSGEQRTFYTTHELLGMMMLEPEITHFGRWEFGQLFQTGEQKSTAFDVRDYSREGYQGRWGWTYSWNSWMYNHPWLFGAATAVTAAGVAVAKKKASWAAVAIDKVRRFSPTANVPYFGSRATARAIKEGVKTGTTFRGGLEQIKSGFSAASPSGMWQGVTNLQLFRRGAHLGAQSVNLAAGVGAAAFAADVGGLFLNGAYEATIAHKVRAWKAAFGIKTSLLHLAPQDDNLFPPHPKDYMRLDAPRKQSIGDSMEGIAAFGLGIDGARALRANTWDYYLHPERLMNKKVDPQAVQYQITGSTVWDLFHEMTLRHPGWIYGVRPYGHSFEYRMFFGPPNQRYWSKPVPAEFIDRMNRLHKYIDEDGIDSGEFDSLYEEDRSREISEKVEVYQTEIWAEQGAEYWFLETDGLNRVPTGGVSESYADTAAIEAMANKERTAIAMREYLRGLNLRFVPFRRHHTITSGTDIIHNGIMGTTNASYNAVDVRYVTDARKEDADFTQSRTTLVKAHNFIPDSQTRIHPISYPNCRTYEMAVRYGVGQLLHDLREMYRGEILLVGNPRIRPWDICVMIDTYNDMVGPLEVEQVVHTFSYETGFVTEIKPGMVVTANEISTWPILEGLKIFALAVQDIEYKYKDMPAGDTGLVLGMRSDAARINRTLAHLFPGAAYNDHIYEQYKERFGPSGATFEDFGIAYGLDPSQSIASDLLDATDTAAMTLGAAGIGLLTFLTRGSWARIVGRTGTWKDALAAGSVLGAAGLGATAYNYTLTPNIIWLMSGTNIFLQCLKNETIIAIPIMKNGTPIVSGLTTGDPEAMYKSFAGGINRWIEDSVEGTINLAQLYSRYGTAAWNAMQIDSDSPTWGLFNDDLVNEYGQSSQ